MDSFTNYRKNQHKVILVYKPENSFSVPWYSFFKCLDLYQRDEHIFPKGINCFSSL